MDYHLILFEKENYLPAKCELVKRIYIGLVFFLTFLTIHKKDINFNYDTGLSSAQLY